MGEYDTAIDFRVQLDELPPLTALTPGEGLDDWVYYVVSNSGQLILRAKRLVITTIPREVHDRLRKESFEKYAELWSNLANM